MKMDKEYYLNKITPNISEDTILITGDCAMVMIGHSLSNVWVPTVLVDDINLKDVFIKGIVRYFYIPKVDYEHWVVPYKGNDKILLPTLERCIVECCMYGEKIIDPGYFCDSLERYQHSPKFNYDLLKEIAEFFNVPIDKIDYWLEESEDYNSY